MSERRESARFCPRKPAEVTLKDSSGADHTALVLNESLGGAALLGGDGCTVIPGTTVSVMYQGSPVRAIVWHSRRQPEGTVVFGVEWLD